MNIMEVTLNKLSALLLSANSINILLYCKLINNKRVSKVATDLRRYGHIKMH